MDFFEKVFIFFAFLLLAMLCIVIHGLLNSNVLTQIAGSINFLIGFIIIYKILNNIKQLKKITHGLISLKTRVI